MPCKGEQSMNKTIFFTASLLMMSFAEAAPRKIIPAANQKSASTYSTSPSTNNGLKFEARPGAGVTAGYFTFGMNLEGKYGFNLSGNSLFVGLETGVLRTNLYSDSLYSAGITRIPITPSANFEFALNNQFKLYAGTSLGIEVATASESYSNSLGLETGSASLTRTVFLWKFRPGMVLNNKFIAELPLGTVDGNFYFMPNVGVRF